MPARSSAPWVRPTASLATGLSMIVMPRDSSAWSFLSNRGPEGHNLEQRPHAGRREIDQAGTGCLDRRGLVRRRRGGELVGAVVDAESCEESGLRRQDVDHGAL